MGLTTHPWRVELYHDPGQHVIRIFYFINNDDAAQCVLNILVHKFAARAQDSVIGPYFKMTPLRIGIRRITFLEDDAEGYPIVITSDEESDFHLMEAIASVLNSELRAGDMCAIHQNP